VQAAFAFGVAFGLEALAELFERFSDGGKGSARHGVFVASYNICTPKSRNSYYPAMSRYRLPASSGTACPTAGLPSRQRAFDVQNHSRRRRNQRRKILTAFSFRSSASPQASQWKVRYESESSAFTAPHSEYCLLLG